MTTIDPRFSDQARDFITESIKQTIPGANVDAGSGINAIFARGGSNISASLFQEIEHMRSSRDLSDPEAIGEEDMDLLLANLVVERDGGSLSYGIVRLHYNDRVIRDFDAGLTATIESSEFNFVTISDLRYQPQDYFIDENLGLYYINVPFVSEDVGKQYDVETGEINQLLNDVSGAVRVSNPSAFHSGAAKQTNTQALRLAQRSVSTRTPLSRDGAIYWLQKLFGSKLRDLLVVGNGDEEMLRDELYDLGESVSPRFRIGIDGLAPLAVLDGSATREQLGEAQGTHVGGRTNVYMLMNAINYVQQHVDLFADMLLNSLAGTTLVATFVEGTTGRVPTTGKILIDLGNAAEEVLTYSSAPTTVDNNTFTFTLDAAAFQSHSVGASVKVVNNGELTVGEDADISILPVFQIAEIRLLDPITFEPIGDPVPETTHGSREPGWYVAKTNPYDLLSARETKIIVLDEKRGIVGNQGIYGDDGETEDYLVGTETYTKYTNPSDFTGYEGREITFSGAVSGVRTILWVLSATEIVVKHLTPEPFGVNYVIDDNFVDYNEYPVRVSYYTNTEIAEAQQFFDQDKKRILAGDTLVRAFMPVFLDFTMYYRGDGKATDIRLRINEMLKISSGESIGESEGARFEYSDLISAAYEGDLANYVVTPFEVRVRRLQSDGGWGVQYVNPGSDTINELAIKATPNVSRFTADGTLAGNVLTTAGAHTFVVGDVDRRVWISGVGVAKIVAYTDPSTVTLNTSGGAIGVDWAFPTFFLSTTRPSSIDAFNVPAQGRLMLGAFTDNQETIEYLAVETSGNDHVFITDDDNPITYDHGVNEPLKVSTLDYDETRVITDGVITDEREYRPFLGQVIIEKL